MRREQRSSYVHHLETLEPRVLMHGLTVITHGFEPSLTDRPDWLDAMADAIVARKGASTAVYAVRVEDFTNPTITSFTRLSGPLPGSALNLTNESVLLIDYADASDVVSDYVSTAAIADLVTPMFTTTFPALGMTGPLASGPIHLIGHSRGASLVSEIAKNLGEMGLWVDQLTALDPAPVGFDSPVRPYSNVIFADNYFQISDPVVQSTGIQGFYNVGPMLLPGGYEGGQSSGFGTFHQNVHLYYHGTIDTAVAASDGTFTVNNAWYPQNNTPRQLSGWFYSRLVGGSRPTIGLGPNFGGNGQRTSLTLSGAQWPNIGFVTPSVTQVRQGQALTVRFKCQVTSLTPATVTFFLDKDQNPYNNNAVAIGGPVGVGPTGPLVLTKFANALVGNAAPGVYFLQAKISNSTATRYDYSNLGVTVSPALNVRPRGFIDSLNFLALKGWAQDPTTPTQSIVIGYQIDNRRATWILADDARPGLVPIIGSANHGFSVTLPTLRPGVHTMTLLGVDSTNGNVFTLAKKTFVAY